MKLVSCVTGQLYLTRRMWSWASGNYRIYSIKHPPQISTQKAQKVSKHPSSNKRPPHPNKKHFCTSPAWSKRSIRCVPKLVLDTVVSELLYCLWLVYVSFCTLFCLVEVNKLSIPCFVIFFKDVLACWKCWENNNRPPRISAHPDRPKIK